MKVIDGCQVALRFPHSIDSLVAGGAACQSVVSGRSWHTDGLRQGKKHSFSILIGIALSDVQVRRRHSQSYHGNTQSNGLSGDVGDGGSGSGSSDRGNNDEGYDNNNDTSEVHCDDHHLGQLWVWPKSHVTCHKLMRWPDGQVLRDKECPVQWDTAGRDGSRDGQAAGVG